MLSFDEIMMKRAVTLAKKGIGYVSPNPLVGAVIVKDKKVIGEGWHRIYGAPHAEVEAIKSTNMNDLSGCTIYVNLEPCNHYGKTPPCTDLIIEKKFRRVVVGMQDPNPLVAGEGIKTLQSNNIEVEVGILEEQCKWLNRYFIKHITSGLPYVVAKIAQSFDGAIALSNGQSRWISCEESRRRAHKLRAELDAVLIGKGTALLDNPSLTVRSVKGRNPIRIVLDSKLSLPHNLQIFDTSVSRTILCFSDSLSSNKTNEIEKRGVETLAVKTDSSGMLDLEDLLSKHYKYYNIGSIMLEGGAKLLVSFLEANLIDELHLFIAPKIIGEGKRSFNSFFIENLSLAPQFIVKHVRKSDKDIEVIAVK